MSIPNLGYIYYKEYYNKVFDKYYDSNKDRDECRKNIKEFIEKDKSIDEINDVLLKAKIKDIEIHLYKLGKQQLFLKTTYPGLLIGSGNSHSIGVKNESKLGLEFDYTTGLPIINGSSVKGSIRSVFELLEIPEYKDEVLEYFQELLSKITNKNKNSINEKYILDIKNDMFEGKDVDGKCLPLSERDIFFEAVIDLEKNKESVIDSEKDEKSVILNEDYITPHKENLKNPVPIKFVKIRPEIIFRFQFDFKDGKLKASEKLELVKTILFDFGIGAKTNVGYGRFDENYNG